MERVREREKEREGERESERKRERERERGGELRRRLYMNTQGSARRRYVSVEQQQTQIRSTIRSGNIDE